MRTRTGGLARASVKASRVETRKPIQMVQSADFIPDTMRRLSALLQGPNALKRPKRLAFRASRCLACVMTNRPTHLDETGAAHMVDVGAKPVTQRRAVAGGRITMSAGALEAIRNGNAPKGDVLSTARIAGIMAAKRTAELIPLCHPLALTKVGVDFEWEDNGISVIAVAQTSGPTGVEMEALTAASVALLTLYDMAKALDRAMVLGDIRLLEKSGGRSGDWCAA